MRRPSLQKLHRAVDRHAAERVSIQPMQAGGYLAGAPSGEPAEVMAYVAKTSSATRTSGGDANSGHDVELISATDTAKFTTSALPFAVESGFVLTRLDPPARRRYRVSGAYAFGVDRTILALVRIPT